jgi:PAP2 superfamily
MTAPDGPSGWREATLALAAYGAYLTVRRLVWTEAGRARADRNAKRVIAFERRVGALVEPRVQRVAARAPVVVDVVNAGYALGNVALSVGWLAWLHRRGDPGYRRERRAALVAFLGALPVFLAFPTAPPRTQAGFTDTLADRGIDLDHPLVRSFYNPIAAMPSHHVAFAVVTGAALAARARGSVGRVASWSYAPLVSGVVIATGNHYLADVVAGAGLGLLARRCVVLTDPT